jgi:hypothetical protein
MTTLYQVKLAVTLRPIWHNDPPWIKIGIDNILSDIVLTETTTINFDVDAVENCKLIIEFLNKTDQDSIPEKNLDKVVVIESISFFGITDPKFVWAGIYEPIYPEPWATEQQDLGVVLPQRLSNTNHLSWNGKWTLTVDVPVFTWIHKVQDLGWIYQLTPNALSAIINT